MFLFKRICELEYILIITTNALCGWDCDVCLLSWVVLNTKQFEEGWLLRWIIVYTVQFCCC